MADNDSKEYTGEWWQKELGEAQKTLNERWGESAEKVVGKYLDRREADQNHSFRFNIFWANVGILKAALYANPPKPMVTRQFSDMNDDVARVASNILERLLQNDFTKDKSEIHNAFRMAVEDRLVPGLGQVWMIYEPTIGQGQIPEVKHPQSGTILSPASTYKKITNQRVCAEYVNWKDFLWSPARTWEEVWWVARRIWMRKERLIARWGQKTYDKIRDSENKQTSINDHLPKGFKKNKFELFEIWCKATNKVYIVCRDITIEEKKDPLELDDFFPCPKALLATHTTNEWMPRADYVMLQDQYDELDELTTRIFLLEKALRVVGVYDNSCTELKQMLTSTRENEMIGVTNWGNLSEKGGLKGVVDWFPLETIAEALDKVRQQKMDKIQEIYELSGISDIMRGATKERETAAAQKLKAQYSSVRLQFHEQEVAIFVRDVLRLKAEIIINHYDPEVMKQQSNIMATDDAQFADQAIQLLKDSSMEEYRVEVSEESLSLPDYNQEKEMRVEYLTAVGQFISQIEPLIKTSPQAAPYLMKAIQWVSSGFRGSKEIESVLDQAFSELQKAAQQPPPPNPEQVKQQGEMQREQMKGNLAKELKQIEAQIAMMSERAKIESTATIEQQKLDNQKELEILKGRVAIVVAQVKAGADQENINMSLDHEVFENEADRQHEQSQLMQEQIHESKQAQADRTAAATSQGSQQAHDANQGAADRAQATADTQSQQQHESQLSGDQQAAAERSQLLQFLTDRELRDQETQTKSGDQHAQLMKQMIDSHGHMTHAFTKLAEAMGKPRIRRPVRDAKGDITEVHETVGG